MRNIGLYVLEQLQHMELGRQLEVITTPTAEEIQKKIGVAQNYGLSPRTH